MSDDNGVTVEDVLIVLTAGLVMAPFSYGISALFAFVVVLCCRTKDQKDR